MTRGIAIGIAVGALLVGFAAGRSMGTRTVVFPDADLSRSASQMEEEVRTILTHPLASVRASSLARLYEGLTPENVSGAARAITERAGRWDPIDLQVFLASWVRIDPEAAMEEIRSWPIQSRRELGTRIAVREWAATGEWLAAVEYVQTAMDPRLRDAALGPLVRGWALSGDFVGAQRQARRIFESGEHADVVDGLVRGILHVGGPETVLAVARRLSPESGDPFDVRVARVSLDLVIREDPPAAAAYYDELAGDNTPDWLIPSIARIAQIWRNQDPRPALEWLLTLEANADRDQALGLTMADWGIRDLGSALGWLEHHVANLPAARTTGQLAPPDSLLVAGLLPKLSRVRPARAAEWVVRLPDGAGRDAFMRRIARLWAREDATAAAAWVDDMGGGVALRRALEAKG